MKYNTDVRCTRDAVAQIGKSLFEVVFEIRFSTDFRRFFFQNKDIHIIVAFAYLSSSYSKFEWAENMAVQARTKKLSGKQI